MKKKLIMMVLTVSLSFVMFGCGNSETKQEEQKEQETESDEVEEDVSDGNDYSDIVGKEFENDEIYVKIENTNPTFGINGDYTNEYKTLTTDKELTIYCDGGFEIGHIKQGATIEIETGTFEGNPSAYYRFPNPIGELPFEYIYVGSLDCDLIFESSVAEAETEQESQTDVDPYQNIVSVLDEMIDSEKTYTQEEFEEFITEFFEKIDYITYNPDLSEGAKTLNQTVNLQGDGIKDCFNRVFYNIYGSFGWCEEMGINITGANGNELELEIKFTYE